MDMQAIMRQAKEMQTRMQQMQEELGHMEVTGESGGGMVKVVMTCKRDLKKVEIAPELMLPEEKETLEDLIVAAVNMAGQNAEQTMASETQKMMQEFGLPANFELPDF
ncbi:MAG: YbaB/EbfC family nucleoid-associated protein [Rhodospirillales bacterium]|nr:YbaB/EbfC family nucleoid-associated protein [Rhodospirillales bacterium]MCB9996259.1 YbaB/EbfC family nucleoid-associated protein [Rhodospirillales bacterium]